MGGNMTIDLTEYLEKTLEEIVVDVILIIMEVEK
jgi:hypothetical protein